ncbi:MAG: DUF5985 family protein [Gemmatimonadaceae bacterium]
MNPALVLFLSGMLATGYLVAAGFFFRFWKQTRDRFFAFFSLAFGLMALQRALLVDEFALVENKTWAYGLRLLAFLVIVYAIVAKNRERKP